MKPIARSFAAALCGAVVVLVPAGVAQAAPSEDPPAPEPLTTEATATVETYTDNYARLISEKTYPMDTQGMLMPADDVTGAPTAVSPDNAEPEPASGSGGSSSASGCRKVTVTNVTKTVLGFTAYKFNTMTKWCWTRSTQTITSASPSWTISSVDSQQYWRGINRTILEYYDYSTNDGHPKSAYKHYRQGRFENCVLKYGCIGTTYPTNTIRSYYNGTWAWSTSG